MTPHANSRLEAFCDAVFAIALTLLIIDVRIPATTTIDTSADLWRALRHLLPSVFAFVLSFVVILISWVNHHGALKVVDKSSTRFVYANGFLLLGVVFVPFPTALLGESLLTNHASPAVVLYSATGALMAVGWALVGLAALHPEPLTRNASATAQTRKAIQHAYFAFVFYAVCSIVAVWLPLVIAAAITLMWIYWVIYGIRTARELRKD